MSTTYGIGGYLPDHPTGNIVEQIIDNGDGTGTRTTFHADGTVDTVEQLTGLPIPPPPEPDPMADTGDLPVDLLLDATDPRDTSRIRRSEP